MEFRNCKKNKDKGYDSLFVICDKALPICNAERLYKSREEDKHIRSIATLDTIK